MRVLKDMVLVAITVTSSDSLVADSSISRKGKVELTGSNQLSEGDTVLFGEKFEEIDIEIRSAVRYYLMHESNIKIVFDGDDPSAQSNILQFKQAKAV